MDTEQALSESRFDNSKDAVLKETLTRTSRQAMLLGAATEVSQIISSILDPDELLPRTVDLICDRYGFYYAGIFLVETLADGRRWAVLKAGRGKAGRIMIENNHKLEVGGRSMIGACTALNEARIALDVGKEAVWFNNPFLPDTRSEMALPLAIGGEVIGALTVQSIEESAFSDDDVSSLQAMAGQRTPSQPIPNQLINQSPINQSLINQLTNQPINQFPSLQFQRADGPGFCRLHPVGPGFLSACLARPAQSGCRAQWPR